MLLIFYNINHHSFYQVYKSFQFNLELGYVNGFGHILVQILYFENNKFYNVANTKDCYLIVPKLTKRYVIKRLIRFLNKKL